MIRSRLVDKPLILYGYGQLGHLAEEVFKKLGITPIFFVDKNIPEISLTCFVSKEIKEHSLLAICIANEPYYSVIEPLIADGWKDVCSVYDIFEAYPECRIGNGWTTGLLWKDEVLQIKEVHEKWDDAISRSHYSAFLRWRIYRKESQSFIINTNHLTLLTLLTLPSTLADIEKRQRVMVFDDVPMKSISIHTEGYELETIEVNMRLLQKYKPNIDVACYHSRDGLWKIEKVLMNGLPDYCWMFRLHAYSGQAAYIYGIPKERGEG